MSDQQIITEVVAQTEHKAQDSQKQAPLEVIIETAAAKLSPDDKPARTRRRRATRRKSDVSDKATAAKTSPSRPDQVLIGRRPAADYVYLVKKLFKENKHESVVIAGVSPIGNPKVIWIANRMVEWGYASITKIQTSTPSALEIRLKKADDFEKVWDAFEVARAEKHEVKKEKRAADKAASDKKKAGVDEALESTDAETAKVAMTAVEAVVEEDVEASQ